MTDVARDLHTYSTEQFTLYHCCRVLHLHYLLRGNSAMRIRIKMIIKIQNSNLVIRLLLVFYGGGCCTWLVEEMIKLYLEIILVEKKECFYLGKNWVILSQPKTLAIMLVLLLTRLQGTSRPKSYYGVTYDSEHPFHFHNDALVFLLIIVICLDGPSRSGKSKTTLC